MPIFPAIAIDFKIHWKIIVLYCKHINWRKKWVVLPWRRMDLAGSLEYQMLEVGNCFPSFKKIYTIRKASTIYLYAYTMMQISNFSLIKINNVIPLWLTKFKEYMYLFCKMSKSFNSCTKLGALVKHLLTNQTNQQTLMLMVLRHFRVLLSGVICNVSKKISSSILFTF